MLGPSRNAEHPCLAMGNETRAELGQKDRRMLKGYEKKQNGSTFWGMPV